jgi:CRP-like cAMP-binding protein
VIGILESLLPRDREALEADAVPRVAEAGDVLLRADDVNASLWVVLAGRVEVRLGSGNATRTAGTIGPGGFFGEVSLFEPGLTCAAVIARQRTVVLELPKELLTRFGEERPAGAAALYLAIVREISRRVRAMDRELAESVYWLFE